MIDLDTIFRSLINFKNDRGELTITQKALLKNFRALQEVIPDPPEEKVYKNLYYFLYNYVKDCTNDAPELPSYEFAKNYYEEIEGSEAVLALLEKIKTKQPYVGQDFRKALKMYNEDQNVLRFERVLSNANKIASVGMPVGYGRKKRVLKGTLDAINYLAVETKPLQQDITGVKLESQVISPEEADEVIEEYERVKKDPVEALGIYTGLTHIDKKLKGLKNTELMLVAAWTGHCKTTFSLNMMYRAVYSGWNVAFITLEMSHAEIRRAIYVLHSCNQRRFRKVCPQFKHLIGTLKYNDITYGTLTEEEEEYFRIVVDDIKNSPDYGKLYIWQPAQTVTTVSDIDFKARQIQQEFQADGRDLEFIILDYITLLGNDESTKTRDYNQSLNNNIKALKRLCLTFNNGKGCRMLSPFQVNREGYKEAKKNDGVYFPTALSNAHEAERSSDCVIALYVNDDDRNSGMIKVCNLKARRDKPFSAFNACINFDSKYIYDYAGDHEDNSIKNMELILSNT